MPGEFGDLEEIRNEYKAKLYCSEWLPEKRWLTKNGIKHTDYPEEVQFKKYLQEYKFFKRAAAIQILHAHNQIREELVTSKM